MTDRPAAATSRREPFELAGAASRPIRGEAILVSDPVASVVVLHGFKGFYRASFFPYLGESIAAAGMNAILFNFSGSGVGEDLENFTEPDAFAENTYGRELYDVSIVMQAARERGWIGERCGLFGHSRGGGVAILHASRDERVGALVTWAAISTVARWSDPAQLADWRRRGYVEVPNTRTGIPHRLGTRVLDEVEKHGTGRLDIGAAASRVKCPWLIVHGDRDETVPLEEAERLAAAAPAAELWRVPGAMHSFGGVHGMTEAPAELREVVHRTTDFLRGTLATG